MVNMKIFHIYHEYNDFDFYCLYKLLFNQAVFGLWLISA